MGVVTPPVGLNIFAVSGTSKIPVTECFKGAVPFFLADLLVLVVVILIPALALWVPGQLVTDVFK
jgi:TRAP-type C4-dicarboxylate transport system permease large subunit